MVKVDLIVIMTPNTPHAPFWLFRTYLKPIHDLSHTGLCLLLLLARERSKGVRMTWHCREENYLFMEQKERIILALPGTAHIASRVCLASCYFPGNICRT